VNVEHRFTRDDLQARYDQPGIGKRKFELIKGQIFEMPYSVSGEDVLPGFSLPVADIFPTPQSAASQPQKPTAASPCRTPQRVRRAQLATASSL
jgi:hypothetical protein